jgi:hypothetical protein
LFFNSIAFFSQNLAIQFWTAKASSLLQIVTKLSSKNSALLIYKIKLSLSQNKALKISLNQYSFSASSSVKSFQSLSSNL